MTYLDLLPKDVLNIVNKYQNWQQRNDKLIREVYHHFLFMGKGQKVADDITNIFKKHNLNSHMIVDKSIMVLRLVRKNIINDDCLLDIMNYGINIHNFAPDSLLRFNEILRLSDSPLRIVVESKIKYVVKIII